MTPKFMWFSLSLILCNVTGFAFNDGIRMAWPPKVGASAEYKVENILTTPFGSKVTFAWTTTKTVKAVSNMEVTMKAESTVPVETTDGPTGCPVKLAGPSGNIAVAANGGYLPSEDEEGGMAARFGNLSAVIFPQNPISVGETWQHEVKADPKTDAQAARATYKLLGEETIGKWPAYKISVDYQETAGEEWEQMSLSGIKWFSVADGMLVQEKLHMQAPHGVDPLYIEIESKRVK